MTLTETFCFTTIGRFVEFGREDEVRTRYGDAAVDAYFRIVEGANPHDERCECGDPEGCELRDASLPYVPGIIEAAKDGRGDVCAPELVQAVLAGTAMIADEGAGVTPALRDFILGEALPIGAPAHAGDVEGIVIRIEGREYTLDVPAGGERGEVQTFDLAELLPLVGVAR